MFALWLMLMLAVCCVQFIITTGPKKLAQIHHQARNKEFIAMITYSLNGNAMHIFKPKLKVNNFVKMIVLVCGQNIVLIIMNIKTIALIVSYL